MIRRVALPFHNQENVRSRRTSSLSYYSAMKTKKCRGMNLYGCTNATMPTLHFHFGDNHRPVFHDSSSNVRPKSLTIESFHKNRDDNSIRRLANHSSSSNAQNPVTITARTYPPEESKECVPTNKDQPGRVLGSYNGKLDDLLATISCDTDDQIFFPLNELERDLDLIANPSQEYDMEQHLDLFVNPSQELTLSGPSPKIEHVEHYRLTPSSSASMHADVVSSASRQVDPTNENHPYLKLERMSSTKSNVPTLSKTNASPSLRVDSDSISPASPVASKSHFIGGNHENDSPIFYRQSKTSHKRSVSMTRHKHWTGEEDEILRDAITKEGKVRIQWEKISKKYFRKIRSAAQCKVRWNNHVQPGIVRGKWHPYEDQIILKMVSEGCSWKRISDKLPGRTNESVRYRFVNTLDPNLKTTPWTKEEDETLFRSQRKMGNKWSEIGRLLPGRSDNAVKNRYYNKKNSFLRKMTQSSKKKSEKSQLQAFAKALGEANNADIGEFAQQFQPTTSDGANDACDSVIAV